MGRLAERAHDGGAKEGKCDEGDAAIEAVSMSLRSDVQGFAPPGFNFGSGMDQQEARGRFLRTPWAQRGGRADIRMSRNSRKPFLGGFRELIEVPHAAFTQLSGYFLGSFVGQRA